jgi:hypothetical protein
MYLCVFWIAGIRIQGWNHDLAVFFFPFQVTVFHMWLIRCFELQVIVNCLIQVLFF